MQSCTVCPTHMLQYDHTGQSNCVEIEGYEKVHARTHVSFSIADTMEWFRQLKMLLFQE